MSSCSLNSFVYCLEIPAPQVVPQEHSEQMFLQNSLNLTDCLFLESIGSQMAWGTQILASLMLTSGSAGACPMTCLLGLMFPWGWAEASGSLPYY